MRDLMYASNQDAATREREFVMPAHHERPHLAAPTPRPQNAPLALTGIRVADFSHFIAGPLCTMMLGDLGAEVIKIEKPDGGDDFRRMRPPVTDHEGGPYLWCNRNKKSIAVNLKHPDGQMIARRIVDAADVLVENFATGVMAKFGLDYETVSVSNPGLIYASISAYGRTGPNRDRLGFDPIAQAESGFMSMNGDPDRVGVRAGPSVMDMSTAMMTTNAVLAALYARQQLGRGQLVETALFDTAISMVGFHAINYLVSGDEPTRFGNNSRDSVPCNALNTADEPIFFDCASDRTWQRLASLVLDRADLADHPDYAHIRERARNRDVLMAIIQDILKTKPRAFWLARMREAGVPAGAVNSIAEAFSSDVVASRNLVHAIPHPVAGSVPNIRLPFQLHGTPLADPRAAPGFSQHAVEILRGVLHYDETRIAELAESGAVVLPSR